MPFRRNHVIDVPPSLAVQAITVPNVFSEPGELMGITTIEVLCLPTAGAVWLGFLTSAVAVDGPDVFLIPDGSPWASFPVGNAKFRQLHRANVPNFTFNVLHELGGGLELTFY